MERRLAAILIIDMVGFSQRIERDEEGTVARHKAHRDAIIDPIISAYSGRIVKTIGDGLLVEFQSVVDAVKCAVEVQQSMAKFETGVPTNQRIQYRIGINLGDIIVDGEDILGDGVNVAARLESLAKPGGICLSGAAHEQLVGKLNAVFEDAGEQQVRNVQRPVRIWQWQCDGAGGDRNGVTTPSQPASGRSSSTMSTTERELKIPSLLVLPFRNLGADQNHEFLADGITEDILTALSKISQLRVISRNSTFAYRSSEHDARRIANELDVQHVLEGSVRQAGNRVRVSAQLIRCSDGSHVWADRYDRPIDDIFALHDEMALNIAAELQVELLEGEMARLRSSGTKNVEAWSDYMRAIACTRAVNKDSYAQARRLAERAIELDPNYAAAIASLAWVHWLEARAGWSKSRKSSVQQARDLATQAIALDPENAEAHGVLGLVELIEGRHDSAIRKLETALDLNANHADLVAYLAIAHVWNGHSEIATGIIRKAMHLSPVYPAWYSGVLGFALRLLGRYSEAIEAFRDYSRREPAFGHVDLTIIYTETNQSEAAQREADEVLRYVPEFSINEWAKTQLHSNSEPLNRDVEALRKAGLPN